MSENVDHDTSPSATAIDAATLTARQLARAAALAADNLDNAERATKPAHARRLRLAGFGALQDCRVLSRRAMHQLADASAGELVSEATTVELVAVLRELDAMAKVEASLTGSDAVARAAAMLVAKFGGGR